MLADGEDYKSSSLGIGKLLLPPRLLIYLVIYQSRVI